MKVVYYTPDRIGLQMAGPAMRATEISKRLADHHQVTLLAPGGADFDANGYQARDYTEAALAHSLRDADVFLTQGFSFPIAEVLRFRGRLVLDLYDPVQLEQLTEFGPTPTPRQRVSLAHVRARLKVLLARADNILCASERQRVYWLGWLSASGRLNPEALENDREARKLIAVVPFGLSEVEPERSGNFSLRDRFSLSSSDSIILWCGGLWDWMDSELPVRALREVQGHAVSRDKPPHLVFLAGPHPMHQGGAGARTRTRELAQALGLESRVHLVEEWVPYADRASALLESALAVSAHKPSVEAQLAFRTRLLDCLWTRLPVACTSGDVLADDAERDGWGRTAPPGDVAGLARCFAELLHPAGNKRARDSAERVRRNYTWNRSVETLLALLEAPPPTRPALLTPGEFSGESPLVLANALFRKMGRVLTRPVRGRRGE